VVFFGFSGFLAYLTFKDSLPVFLLGFYVAICVLTFLMYAFDKSAAKKGQWRTPEKTLHLLALMGGWPGAMLAQSLLHHKSTKKSFLLLYWLTIVLHISFTVWFFLN